MKTPEERLEAARKNSRDYHKRMRACPEGRERLNATKRRHYARNKERVKKQVKESYERNWGGQAAYTHSWTRRRPDVIKAQRSRGYKRGLKATIAAFRAGRIGFDELDRRLGLAIVRLNERRKPG